MAEAPEPVPSCDGKQRLLFPAFLVFLYSKAGPTLAVVNEEREREIRGVGNERNLVHLVEKSVEIKLKSLEIKADFLEIKLGNQPNPPAPPTFTTHDVIFEGNQREIRKSRTPKLLVADPSEKSNPQKT